MNFKRRLAVTQKVTRLGECHVNLVTRATLFQTNSDEGNREFAEN